MGQNSTLLLCAAIASLLAGSTVVSKGAAPASGGCSYDVTVSLESGGELANCISRLTYRNASGQALDTLVLHYKPGPRDEAPPVELVVGDGRTELLTVSPWKPEGQPVADHMAVRLPQPLAPGQAVTLKIRSVAAVQDKFGIKRLEGCWNPRVVQFDKGRWTAGVDEFACYRVKVGRVQKPYLPASGALGASTQDLDGTWTLTFASGIIPDFALVFSAADNVVSSASGGVGIQCFYVRDKAAAEEMLSIAGHVVSFYRELYGFYPDTVLNIIMFDGQGFGGGPIGSNIGFVNNTFAVSRDDTQWAVAHEIAHEYWGWNSVIVPQAEWLSLGMGLWTDAQYTDSAGIAGRGPYMLSDYLSAAKHGLDTRLAGPTPGWSAGRMDENQLAHDKGFQVVKMLEYVVGKEAMRKIAREAQRTHAHGVIDVAEFQAICQEVAAQKLDWFFNEWVETGAMLDYRVVEVKATTGDGTHGWIVSFDPGKGLIMPIDVLMEFTDGSISRQRTALDSRQVLFASEKDWRRVMIDPSLPNTGAKSVLVNPKALPLFDILDVNLGDKAWGLNQLKVRVRNNSDTERPLFIHIGGSPGGNPPGFGMGQLHAIPPRVEHTVIHWYYIPPTQQNMNVRVKFIDPVDPMGTPENEPPFMTTAYQIAFPMPNDRCNNLTITEELPVFKKFYGSPQHLEPFKSFVDDGLVLYCSPGTPAFNDAAGILKVRKAALDAMCAFAGVKPEGRIALFLFPDRATKRMCTVHEGDGLARGNELYEVYNEKTHVDPHHEICHIVMGRIGNPPAAFNEGLAVWMQEGHRWNDEEVHRTAHGLLASGKLIPLAELMKRDEIGSRPDDGKVAYPESASFVGFLLETYGRDKFLAAYQRLRAPDNEKPDILQANLAALRDVYVKDLKDLEAEWRQQRLAVAP